MSNCDTGIHGSPENETGVWLAEYPDAGDHDHASISPDNPLNFALFGLARQGVVPSWVETDWSKTVLDLGPGNKLVSGAVRCEYPEYNFEAPGFNPMAINERFAPAAGVDTMALKEEDLITGYRDKTSLYRATLPYPDESVGGIYAVNIFEHLWDPRPIMEECARVLAVGAPLNVVVPHGKADIYLQDLDHKKPFILDSWKNWLDNQYWGEAERGKRLRLKIGMNFKFAIKEENVNVYTQLIKVAE